MGRWCDLAAPNAERTLTARLRIPGPVPKYGGHARAILASLGYDGAEIGDMIRKRVAGLQWSDKHLPERIRLAVRVMSGATILPFELRSAASFSGL